MIKQGALKYGRWLQGAVCKSLSMHMGMVSLLSASRTTLHKCFLHLLMAPCVCMDCAVAACCGNSEGTHLMSTLLAFLLTGYRCVCFVFSQSSLLMLLTLLHVAVLHEYKRSQRGSAALEGLLGAQVYSASSDGTVGVWDAKTCECLKRIKYVLFTPLIAHYVEMCSSKLLCLLFVTMYVTKYHPCC